MAATVESSLFTNPKYPRAFPTGPTIDQFTQLIPTTSLDDVGDIYKLIPMRGSRRLLDLVIENAALDIDTMKTLDADIILVDDANPVATPLILWNAGTAFQGALVGASATRIPLSQLVAALKNDAWIGLLVNTVAATADAGNVSLWVTHEGTGG